MRAVVQRVESASVTVGGDVVGAIAHGLAVLVAVAPIDVRTDAEALADKLSGLRIFSDEAGKMNLSVLDVAGQVLLISQFTLLADVRRGRRPSFVGAADPEHAVPLLGMVETRLADLGVPVATGVFGEHMSIALVNDGPVTLVLDIVDGRVV